MAKRIIWSEKAQTERKSIFDYWNSRNRSKEYSRKLNNVFKEAARLIADYPEIGTPTDIDDLRIKVVGDYLKLLEIT